MSNTDSGIVGPDGKKIEHVTIPVVRYKDFTFSMKMVEKEDIVQVDEKGIKPSDIIRELRAVSREMRDRFTILATGLVVAAKEGPEETEAFLNSIGLIIKDVKGNSFFEPTPVDSDKFADEDASSDPVNADKPANT